MDRRLLKKRAGEFLYTTSPRPFIIAAILVLLTQLISLFCMELGGQPFVVDMDAYMAGNFEEAVRYVPENITPVKSVLLLLAQAVSVCLEYGFLSYCLHAARQQKCAILDLMDGFFVFFKALILRVVILIAVSVGMMLFILPGVYLAYTYSMAQRLLLDHPDWSPFRCMGESRRLMSGHKKELFLLHLSLIGWIIASVFPVTAVLTRPYITLSETEFYLDLTGTNIPYVEEDHSGEKPPWEY